MARASRSAGKVDELTAQIDAGLAELEQALEAGKSEQLVAFLDCLSRFHRYSFGNVLLILSQRPDATRVAGFQAWKKLNRHVRKGEKGIGILAPMIRKTESDDDADEPESTTTTIGYRSVAVFDVSQTDGERLPELDVVTGDPGKYIAQLKQQIRAASIDLLTSDLPPNVDGMSSGGTITIRETLSPAEEFSVLVHEFAHELLHQGERRAETTKTIRETEAEAVAFTVCRAIGLETGAASSDYLQLYGGSTDVLKESLHHIRRCASVILDGLLTEVDGELQGDAVGDG